MRWSGYLPAISRESISRGVEDAALYAKGAIVAGGASLLASALVSSLDSAVSRVAALVLVVSCSKVGGEYALREKSEWKQKGAVDFINCFWKTAVIQSFVEVADACPANRFPGLISAGVVAGFTATPFYAISSSVMSLVAIGSVYAKMNQIVLDTIELEKTVSKAIESVEGAKLYPTRSLKTPLDQPMLELCAFVPKDSESL